MRLDPLIKLRIEWNSYELISRGKQLKYWRVKWGHHKACIFAKTRLQNQSCLIFKIAQICLKPIQEDASRCVLFGGIADLSVRPLSVEFWRFEVSNRISAPMSYITFWYVWIFEFTIMIFSPLQNYNYNYNFGFVDYFLLAAVKRTNCMSKLDVVQNQ